MAYPMRSFLTTILSGMLLALASTCALADTLSIESQRLDGLAASRGETQVSTNLSGDFAAFAGSPENADSLVRGLRSGTSISLIDPTAPPGTPAGVAFTPPTRPMGYGNVFISLSLAQKQLAAIGIANPTPAELQAALTGGTILTASGPIHLNGILQMRADGMGWGKIAKTLGFKLGSVVSGLKRASAAVGHGVTTAAGNGTPPTATGKHHDAGIVSASGAAPGNLSHGKAGQEAMGKGSSSAISTGMGNGIGNGMAGGAAGSGTAGITTAAGGSLGNAGGNGMGQARGHGKP